MSKNVKISNPMKVITGVDTRWSYANVWEPKSINGGTPKYSISLIIPKSDTKTIAKIKAAIEAAYVESESKLKGNSKSVPSLAAIETPLRDGDEERPDDPAYANAYFINANSVTAPVIVDADLNPILTRSEVYSGVYGRASITLYAFNSNGNRGIACGLNNLQKIRDGESLGGKASATELKGGKMDKREIFKMYDKIVNSFEGDNTLKCNIKNIKSVESCDVETIIFEISFRNPYSEIIFTASDEADMIMAKLASYINEYTGVQFFFDNNSCSLWIDASNKLPVTIIKKILKDEPHGVSTIVQINEFHHIPDTY